MAELTLIIPSRGNLLPDGTLQREIFLQSTIQDVLENARGDIAVYAVLDGYDIPREEFIDDPRLTYVRLPTVKHTQKRHGINKVIAETTGKYVMALDAHCMVAEGFDVVLENTYVPSSIMIPRRHRLDAENWCLQTQCDDRPPIDYEHTMWPLKFDPPGLHGFKWDERTLSRWNTPIDETMHFQGSCWFMTRDWFNRNHFMQIDGYTGWGMEAEELALETWMNGGQVLTNKHTWYAHLHKGAKHGRMYWMSRQSMRDCNAYAYNLWVYERKDFFIKYIEKWWPVPGWPNDWKERIYGRQ